MPQYSSRQPLHIYTNDGLMTLTLAQLTTTGMLPPAWARVNVYGVKRPSSLFLRERERWIPLLPPKAYPDRGINLHLHSAAFWRRKEMGGSDAE
jgi:hypothetical protein